MAERHFILTGEIDMFTAPQVRNELERVTVGGVDLLVDCAGVTFIDSSGIDALCETRRALEARGNYMILVNARPSLYRLLGLLGLEDMTTYERPSAHEADGRVVATG